MTQPITDEDTSPTEALAAAGADIITGFLAGLGWPRWRYTGPPERVYTHIPITVDPGAVIAWYEQPAGDGCWEPTDDPVTQLPDNHRTETEE